MPPASYNSKKKKLEDAKDIQAISSSTLDLLTESLGSYQKVWTSLLENAIGAKPIDSKVCNENLQLWMGTAARDLSTVNLAWQLAMKVIPPPGP